MERPTRPAVRPPLEGVRVVELGSFVSGPLATMMLADLGAEVTKVEPPRGDPLRRFGRRGPGTSAFFVNVNRGKRSVVLDLKEPADRDALDALLADADVMVCNWRSTVAERLGVVDVDLATRHPSLVRLYITGYGTSGPLAGTPSFDSVLQARVGLTDVEGGGGRPRLISSYVVDKVAALLAGQAVLAALVARATTGSGERIDLAMLDAAAYFDFPDIMVNRTYAADAPAEARNRQASAVRPMAAKDGWLVVAAVTADQIRRACTAVGLDGLGAELLAMSDATALTGRFCDELEAVTRERCLDDVLESFARADVPAAPCLTLDEHLGDPQVAQNELYEVGEWEGLGEVRRVRYPATFGDGGMLWPRSAPPALGEHNLR